MAKTLKPGAGETTAEDITKRLASDALEKAYDGWWLHVLEQLDMAFVSDATMLDRLLYRARAKIWSRTANPMQACQDPGGIVDAVESVVLEPFEIERIQAKAKEQGALRDRLAEALQIPAVCDWKSGLRSHQVRRRVHYAGTLLADWGKISKPAFDPYSKRVPVDDAERMAKADETAAAWVGDAP
jgi:hypothetical protein